MGICGKIFIINLHNLQMLLMLWIKNKFSECLAPLHKHEGPQWKTFWRRFCPGLQTRWAIRRQLPPNLFCAQNRDRLSARRLLILQQKLVAQNLRLGRGLDRTDLDRWKFMHAVLLEMHYKNIHKELLIFIEYPVLEETFNVSTIETASEAKYVLVDCTGKTFAE